jgi:hypothetical protein
VNTILIIIILVLLLGGGGGYYGYSYYGGAGLGGVLGIVLTSSSYFGCSVVSRSLRARAASPSGGGH